ncbi:RluA family pseudouridine synthase [Brevibacillus fluminis]|uniref:Pseudouridine synthase n=1 Tax=Brevibacillus fluminis TaxID=511487 RepID=A0A3M8D472_9BACL|nr:RluA family pseudouridine synthase [Brevibacillus fluminis]RNB81985.1 RluA family pseudouridine synthase [Brevibacillus fluminis]
MSQSRWREYVATEADTELTVEQVIREKLMVSGRMLQRLTRSKGIQLNRKTPFLGRKVKVGDRISVRVVDKPDPAASAGAQMLLMNPDLPAPDVLYEDNEYIIINKPAGMMVHPVGEGQNETLVHVLTAYWAAKGAPAVPHPVHRLDKETSGTVLIAKSSYAHQLADRLLRDNKISREYVAVLSGVVASDEGAVNAPIARDPLHKVRRRVHAKGENAVTHYKVLARSESMTLVEAWLETGRTHQIRVHFAHLGHPLLGDTLYGGERSKATGQALHAHRLSFVHPVTSAPIAVEAKLPAGLATFIEQEFKQNI